MIPTEQRDCVQHYRPLAQLVPAHWHTGSLEADDGTRIHYTRTGGDKPTVLCLHGVQGNGLTWLRTARALEATYEVILPDARGHGLSGRVGPGLSEDVLVDDLLRLLQTLRLDHPFVIGHSLGADLAGRVAAAHPVRGVVLVDPALHNVAATLALDPDAPPPWLQALVATLRSLAGLPHAERMAVGLRLLPPGTPVFDEADYVSFVDAQAQFDLQFFRYAARMGYLVEAPEVIAAITAPVLLLTARPLLPGASIAPGIAQFARHWRAGQHVHFADSGHFIMFEQFARFIAILTRFLAEH